MKRNVFLLLLALCAAACNSSESTNRTLPSIPARRVSLEDFGGRGDGISLNTEAFEAAFAELERLGGGHLDVPSGIWLTGPVRLRDRTDLHLAEGAIVRFSPDPELYPIIPASFEGLDTRRCTSPLSAIGAHDVSITGHGVFDGNGDAWRPLKKSKVTASMWKKKLASGGFLNEKGDCWYPDEDYYLAEQTANMNVPDPSLPDAAVKRFLRPVMVSLCGCENVLLDGCIYQNSPAWNIHPLLCKNLVIRNINVRNPAWSQNGDGIDIESCTGVLLENSVFDCGDDAICIKSGKDEDGRRRGVPCKDLVIRGCTVFHGHGGFVVGSEMSGGVSDIDISDCKFIGTDVGLRFKSKRGRGGVVENIRISGIMMTDIVTDALLFDLHYGGKSAVEALEEGTAEGGASVFTADETTPAFRNIYISGCKCDGARRAVGIKGLEEMPVSGVHIEDCLFRAERGMEIERAENISLNNVVVITEQGEALKSSEVRKLIVDGKIIAD